MRTLQRRRLPFGETGKLPEEVTLGQVFQDAQESARQIRGLQAGEHPATDLVMQGRCAQEQ